MADENATGSKWWLSVVLVPVVVGVVLAIVQFGLPLVFGSRNELSFTIEPPQSIEGLKLNIENTPIGALYVYKVRVWNSGGNALKGLPVLFRFDSSPSDFKILNVSHSTKPAYEFGTIQEEQSDQISRKCTYSLLNREDEDNITFLTTRPGNLGVFAKSENLSVKPISPNIPGFWERNGQSMMIVFAMFISLFSGGIYRLFSKLKGSDG